MDEHFSLKALMTDIDITVSRCTILVRVSWCESVNVNQPTSWRTYISKAHNGMEKISCCFDDNLFIWNVF